MNKDMMAQLGQMQERWLKAQEDIENRVAEATAGGGAVKVEMTGDYKVKSLKIEPDVVDPDDIGMLEDLVIAADERGASARYRPSTPTRWLRPRRPRAPAAGTPGGDAGAGGGAPPGLNRAARRANKR